LRGQAEKDILSVYETNGYTMPEQFVDFPDHIAIQLEFCSLLAAKEHSAAEAGDKAEVTHFRLLLNGFISEHLSTWISPFANAVCAGASIAFYACMTALLQVYLCPGLR
jgi:TorA maturation chaperone TorD